MKLSLCSIHSTPSKKGTRLYAAHTLYDPGITSHIPQPNDCGGMGRPHSRCVRVLSHRNRSFPLTATEGNARRQTDLNEKFKMCCLQITLAYIYKYTHTTTETDTRVIYALFAENAWQRVNRLNAMKRYSFGRCGGFLYVLQHLRFSECIFEMLCPSEHVATFISIHIFGGMQINSR